MRLMYIAIKMKLKELLYSRVYLFVLLLLPVVIGILANYGTKHMSKTILRAVFYLEEETSLSIGLKEILLQDEEIHFMEYKDELALEKAVATDKIECGFVISASIEEEGIIVLVSPSTVAKGPIQETVGAAFFKLVSDDIAFEILENKLYMENLLVQWIGL